MPVTVVVGGQFGSEGKGKVAHLLARQMGASVAVRVGGPNSGHTVLAKSGERLIFRLLPTAAILPDVMCVLPAGSYLLPSLLRSELSIAALPHNRLVIDPNALVIDNDDINEEQRSGLTVAIGSTGSGTGSALIKRIKRSNDVYLAKNHPELRSFVRDATGYCREQLEKGERIIIEGTQGFGLSLLHSPFYPYVTSRDTTASGFLAEAGLSPLDVDDVVMVIRAFPIRVGGASGPLANEVDWSTLTTEGQHKVPIIEFTSVTKVVRRVARFDPMIVRLALKHNQPSRLILNHLDYIDGNVSAVSGLTDPVVRFLRTVEASVDRRCEFVGLGPDSLLSMAPSLKVGNIR